MTDPTNEPEAQNEKPAGEPATIPTDKHPKGLGILFFSEMWERFSFYGMRGLLTLYLVNVVFRDIANKDEVAAHTYGAYGALVYATPFVGGLLADRLLGYKRSVMLGAVLMALGHVAMAIENEFFLYLALAFLIAGNGFFKPNISSMVGGLYGENDPRRDRGFTIFYMGINLGAWLQWVPGLLGETIGWWLGFGLAGVGMLVGLGTFWYYQDVLGTNGDAPDLEKLKAKWLGPISREYAVYIGAFASVGLFAVLVKFYAVMDVLLPTVAAVAFSIVLMGALRAEKKARERLFVVLILTAFNIIFWAFFEQAGSSMSLFTQRNVDRSMFGTFIPTSVFQSVNPLFILILAPLFSLLWRTLGERRIEPSIPAKFSAGLVQLGVGFLVMAGATALWFVGDVELPSPTDPDVLVVTQAALLPLWVLIAGYFFHTCGELCLSPIGLSMVTKLTPRKMVSMVMGLWFLSTSLSHHAAGIIAAATGGAGLTKDTIPSGWAAEQAGLISGDVVADAATKTASFVTPENLTPEVLASLDGLSRYAEVFWPIGLVSVAAGVVLLMCSRQLTRWQHGIE